MNAPGFKLTPEQEQARDAILAFVSDPNEQVFVLGGFAGCGKSTLVKSLIEELDKYDQVKKLINPNHVTRPITLTATTNKAAENLFQITGYHCQTIHSLLGLKVVTDYATQTSTLKRSKHATVPSNQLIVIDEASFVDHQLLKAIFTLTDNCKFLFVGDPAQLTPINNKTTPVFASGFPAVTLNKVVRQAKDNPIIDLATQLRHTVNTGTWPVFTPDGFAIQNLSREDFYSLIEKEFERKDWHYHDSKILAWTNSKVISYNNAVNEHVKGRPEFQPGDYAICNSFICKDGVTIKSDTLVYIQDIAPFGPLYGVPGRIYNINGGLFFGPDDPTAIVARAKEARKNEHFAILQEIESNWIDLRAAYAQTINKAQGSTYNKVFIDLDDLAKCKQGDTLARLLYVAVSRAKDHVYLTGDLV